jgi:hypothetical protein
VRPLFIADVDRKNAAGYSVRIIEGVEDGGLNPTVRILNCNAEICDYDTETIAGKRILAATGR